MFTTLQFIEIKHKNMNVDAAFVYYSDCLIESFWRQKPKHCLCLYYDAKHNYASVNWSDFLVAFIDITDAVLCKSESSF